MFIVSLLYRLHGIGTLLQLMRSRYQPICHASLSADSTGSAYLVHQSPVFQLEELEEDFVLTFIVGKPLIKRASLLRKVFKFKEKQTQVLDNLQTK